VCTATLWCSCNSGRKRAKIVPILSLNWNCFLLFCVKRARMSREYQSPQWKDIYLGRNPIDVAWDEIFSIRAKRFLFSSHFKCKGNIKTKKERLCSSILRTYLKISHCTNVYHVTDGYGDKLERKLRAFGLCSYISSYENNVRPWSKIHRAVGGIIEESLFRPRYM
jgi:hypothetical protein